MLDPLDRGYLKSRGYTDQLLDQERWFSLPKGQGYNEFGLVLTMSRPTIAGFCTTPTGVVTALTTLSREEKAYRRYRIDAGEYLPVYYAAGDDFDLLEETGNVFLVEGIFDRVALKRARVSGAVFALQGLGLSERMLNFLKLTSKRVWLMLDQDKPGKEASERMVRAMKAQDIKVECINYLCKDVNEWWVRSGALKIAQHVDREIELRGWG